MSKIIKKDKDTGLYESFDTVDSYNIGMFKFLVKLAPFVGICAVLTFTLAKMFGLFPDTPVWLVIVFDLTAPAYLILALIINRQGILKANRVDTKVLKEAQYTILCITTIQWNLISYIFPARDFWGYAFLFVLLSAFFFDKGIVIANMVTICISMVVSWWIKPAELLPARETEYIENFILRVVCVIITFTLIYFLSEYSERFKLSSKKHFKELTKANKTLENMNQDVIAFAADIVEQRDAISGSHVKHIGRLVEMLARQMMADYPEYELNEEKIRLISLASTLHDIGKISISDTILLKPGRLTDEEFAIIKTHTTTGVKLLDKLPSSLPQDFVDCSKEICLYHHERYDGNGYPMGLKGDAIPISAQITAVADCFEAMTSKRPYKEAYSPDYAAQKILSGDCGVFSEKVLSCFRKCIQNPEFLMK